MHGLNIYLIELKTHSKDSKTFLVSQNIYLLTFF